MAKEVIIERVSIFSGHKDAVYVLEHASAPGFFFSAGADGMVIEWDAFSADPGKVVAMLPSPVYCLIYIKEQNILLAGTRQKRIYVLDLEKQTQVKQIEMPASVFDMKLIDSNIAAAAVEDGYLYLISIEDYSIINTLHPTDKSARKIAKKPCEKIMASGWSDHYIRIHETMELKEQLSFPAHSNSVFSLAYTPDGKFLLSGGRDAQLKRFDTNSYEMTDAIPAHLFTINDIAIHPSNGLFATASRDKTVKIWDLQTLKLLKVIDAERGGHSHSVNRVLWIEKDGETYLLSTGDDKAAKLWKVKLL